MAVDYFQPETFQQANPLLSGVQAGQQIFQQGVQNAYLPQSLQAQIGLQRAQAGLMGAQTQYFPMTAMAQYLRGAGDYQRALGQNSPLAAYASVQNNPALQAVIAKNPALAKQITNMVVTGSLYGRGATIPGGPQMPTMQMPQQGIGQAQNIPQGIMQNQNALPPATPMPTTPGGTQVPANLPSIQSTGNVPMTPQQQKTLDAVHQYMQQRQQQGQSTTQNQMYQGYPVTQLSNQNAQLSQNPLLRPQDSQTFADTSGSRAIDVTTPKPIQQQRYFAQSFDTQMAPWIPKLPDITNFAGAAGKANLAADKYAAAFNLKNSPQYQNWTAFTNAASELAGNELRRALGVNASVSAKEDMDELQNTGYWNEHPGDALARWNALLAAKHANDQVLAMSQNQALGAVQQSANTPPVQYATQPGKSSTIGPGQYQIITKGGKARVISDDDLAYTAKQNNTTVQAVKQRLGIQ